jgi:hypothetical protein
MIADYENDKTKCIEKKMSSLITKKKMSSPNQIAQNPLIVASRSNYA